MLKENSNGSCYRVGIVGILFIGDVRISRR